MYVLVTVFYTSVSSTSFFVVVFGVRVYFLPLFFFFFFLSLFPFFFFFFFLLKCLKCGYPKTPTLVYEFCFLHKCKYLQYSQHLCNDFSTR